MVSDDVLKAIKTLTLCSETTACFHITVQEREKHSDFLLLCASIDCINGQSQRNMISTLETSLHQGYPQHQLLHLLLPWRGWTGAGIYRDGMLMYCWCILHRIFTSVAKGWKVLWHSDDCGSIDFCAVAPKLNSGGCPTQAGLQMTCCALSWSLKVPPKW